MYAPLVLTLVYRNRLFIRCLTQSYFIRAPVVPITANGTTTGTPSSSKATSHTGAIAGGIAGGVVALVLVVGTIAFVRRRRARRQDDFRKSAVSSFSNTALEAHPQLTVTPFNPTLAGAARLEVGSQIWTASDGPSPTSEPAQGAASVPVGLSSKELARLRSAAMNSPPTHARSSSSGSQPTYTPTIDVTEGSTVAPTPVTLRLQTEVESLRREMQELRAERFEAPPSYGDGGGV